MRISCENYFRIVLRLEDQAQKFEKDIPRIVIVWMTEEDIVTSRG
jgi:hypothetical protein